MRELLNVEGTARLLGVSTHTIRLWIRQERLPVTRLGRRVLFDPRALDRFIRQQTRQAAPPNGSDTA